MAVKDFIPLTDVKQTVEKIVQEKPSIQELTTVESPGKPNPASLLEDEEKNKRKKRKFVSKKPSIDNNIKITQRKKSGILIITEKPQAAQKIASALGDEKKYSEDGVGYFEVERNGKSITVASAVGHLFNLDYKKGQKGWPIFEVEWKPSYEKKSAQFTKRYYDLLKKLASRAQDFIIATDYDIEGEVIGWNVLRFLCNQKTAKRMKFSTLTKDELEKAYESPEKEINWGNAYAGESRHIIDWLYGINLSRALMSAIKTTGSFKILSIGRVQGPALKIIVDREREISSFNPEPYWQVFAYVNKDNNKIEFRHPRDIFQKEILSKFKNIKQGLASTKKSEHKTSPPVPFDLTTLQREAYRLYKLSPSETLAIAQKLYLEGLISYPRTSSQKIPEAIEPKKILKKLAKNFAEEIKNATRQKPIEGKKSDPAHPSIYPTGDFKSLAGKDEKLYSLIARRFISAFCEDLITASKRITLTAIDGKNQPIKYEKPKDKDENTEDKSSSQSDVSDSSISDDDNEQGDVTDNNKLGDNKISIKDNKEEITITFTANAQSIISKGWMAVYPSSIEESSLPDIEGKVKIDEIKFLEKMTEPPSRYSPTSLVSLLEKKNLGTKATRSIIVDTLFQRGYLDGKSIQATPLGLRLIDALEKHSSIIIDENLTRELEQEMEEIQLSKEGFEKKEDEIVEKSKKIISDIAKEFKSKEEEIGKELAQGLGELRQEQQEANTLMLCPTCKKGNLRIMYSKKTRRQFVACSAYPDCKQTYSLPPNALIKKADKICEADNFPKLLAIRKARRPWEFCFNPLCPIEKQKKEEWAAKAQAKLNNQSNEN